MLGTAVSDTGLVPVCAALTLQRGEQATALTKDFDANSASKCHLNRQRGKGRM